MGPAPHPSVAECRKVGHIALDSRELPPKGRWTDFPCCVMGASDQLIADRPDVVQAMTDLMTMSTRWSNAHKVETAEISSRWIGVSQEAVEKSTIIYTTDPTENWMQGESVFLTMLNGMKKFKGCMKAVDLENAGPLLYDFSFVKKSLTR